MTIRAGIAGSLTIALAFLILMFPMACAYEIPANLTNGTLDALIPISQILYFNDSPATVTVGAIINNPSPDVLQLYFAQRTGNTWTVLSQLGNVSPFSSLNSDFKITFEYSGETTKTGDYAIISDKLAVKSFRISEDWSAYEDKTKSSLSFLGFVVTPIIGLILIFLHFLVGREAKRRAESPRPLCGTAFKWSECLSIYEKIIFMLSRPAILVLAIIIVLLLMSYLLITAEPEINSIILAQISATSFVAAFFIPVLLVWLVWYGDIRHREPLSYMSAMFVWGIIAALVAFFVNPFILSFFNVSNLGVPLVLTVVFGSIIVSPVSEEILKAIGVYVMSKHREMGNMLDGLSYGFAVGVGFAAVENWFYFISKMDPLTIGVDAWLISIVYRSFFNTIAHGCFTAFIGAMIGMLKSRPRIAAYSYLGVLPGLFIAIILHMIFNLSAFFDIIAVKALNVEILLFNPLMVVTVGIGFLIIYYFGIVESRKTPIS